MSKDTKKGALLVVSGFSGAGKGTVMKKLLKKYDNYALSISMTTRAPRAGEENGREYFFVDTDTFEQKIEENKVIEYAKYCDNYYGTPREYVEEQLESGKDVILEIEIQGALKVKEMFPDTVLLFIMPPSAEELQRRLVSRGTETAEVIKKRMDRAVEEALFMEKYDYIVINDDLDRCVEELHGIVNTVHQEAARNEEKIETMKKELEELSKGE
ncbi:MAG: guanylate kinase [Lachnospiraceae bacterium]|nr:guanylate kinase [Lachnospiraceae bacterium]